MLRQKTVDKDTTGDLTYPSKHLRRKERERCSDAGTDHGIGCERRGGILQVRINDVSLYNRPEYQYGLFS
jgi:hypothetical protein